MKSFVYLNTPGLCIIKFLLVLNIFSCKKLVEVTPPVTNVNAENVYTTDATSIAAVTGIYAKISDQSANLLSNNAINGISVFTSLSADELELFSLTSASLAPYYKNELTRFIGSGTFWNSLYSIIFSTNSAIEGLENSNSLTPMVKKQLMGESKFMRAFCYFYLVNLYGDVPIVTGTDWKTNAALSRSPQSQVYSLIISDLKDAQSLLNENYLKADLLTSYNIASAERIRPTKWVATALLARAYLYIGDYANAESQSTEVINNKVFFKLSTPPDAFLKNSMETIWAIQPVRTGVQANSGEGALFVLPTQGPTIADYPVYLNNKFVQNFEHNDLRKQYWIDSVKPTTTVYYFPKKYKIGKVNVNTQEYSILFRYSEQYLIRAEARAQQNLIEGSKDDLNAVRNRAGLSNTDASQKSSLLSAISSERRFEFFTEWGHRWFDLKRTNQIDSVMTVSSVQKGGAWSSFKAWYPIPQNEITLSLNVVQNEGYQ